jgi:NAD(P)-dependent dehydrogenase (short-subunit alcohol dehydrogenase family)
MAPKIAIIFGAGPGLAAGLARSLAPTHSLFLLSRSLPGSLPKLELGDIPESDLLSASSDGSKATLDTAFDQMQKKWPDGQVEVAIFNSGGNFSPGKFLERTEEQFRDNLQSFA